MQCSAKPRYRFRRRALAEHHLGYVARQNLGRKEDRDRDESERENRNNSDARSKLNSVDDEALFEEARRRAQQMRPEETKKIER